MWSWKYEGGSYRVASLAETSATSTESNAIQVQLQGLWCVSPAATSHVLCAGAVALLQLTVSACLRPVHALPQLWSHAFIATPNPSGTGTLLEQ